MEGELREAEEVAGTGRALAAAEAKQEELEGRARALSVVRQHSVEAAVAATAEAAEAAAAAAERRGDGGGAKAARRAMTTHTADARASAQSTAVRRLEEGLKHQQEHCAGAGGVGRRTRLPPGE